MRLYSFNDFRYICYIEGKDKAVEKLFAELYETRKLKALQRRIKKNEMDLKSIYDEYLQHQSIVNN
ncbi:hypothetical protein ACJ5AL_002465 [Listeria monocytogenes]